MLKALEFCSTSTYSDQLYGMLAGFVCVEVTYIYLQCQTERASFQLFFVVIDETYVWREFMLILTDAVLLRPIILYIHDQLDDRRSVTIDDYP